VKLILICI